MQSGIKEKDEKDKKKQDIEYPCLLYTSDAADD